MFLPVLSEPVTVSTPSKDPTHLESHGPPRRVLLKLSAILKGHVAKVRQSQNENSGKCVGEQRTNRTERLGGRGILDRKNNTSPASVSPCTRLRDSGLLITAQRLADWRLRPPLRSEAAANRGPGVTMIAAGSGSFAPAPRGSGGQNSTGLRIYTGLWVPTEPGVRELYLSHSLVLFCTTQLLLIPVHCSLIHSPPTMVQPGLKPRGSSLSSASRDQGSEETAGGSLRLGRAW